MLLMMMGSLGRPGKRPRARYTYVSFKPEHGFKVDLGDSDITFFSQLTHPCICVVSTGQ